MLSVSISSPSAGATTGVYVRRKYGRHLYVFALLGPRLGDELNPPTSLPPSGQPNFDRKQLTEELSFQRQPNHQTLVQSRAWASNNQKLHQQHEAVHDGIACDGGVEIRRRIAARSLRLPFPSSLQRQRKWQPRVQVDRDEHGPRSCRYRVGIHYTCRQFLGARLLIDPVTSCRVQPR